MKNDKKVTKKWVCPNDDKPLSDPEEIVNNMYLTRKKEEYSKEDVPEELIENVKKIALTILEDIKKEKKILLWGDYDVDGTSSVLIWVYTFLYLQYKGFGIHIPTRKDGYGLSIEGLERFATKYDTVITMDNGITARAEAEWCRKRNIKLIVTDHHSFTEETRTTAPYILNPMDYPPNYYSNLCGSSISHFISLQLTQKADINQATAFLASMGIIGDVVPLKGYNRFVFNLGRSAIFNLNIPSFMALRKKLKLSSKTELCADDYAFSINPLINACGRMESMKRAVDFFCSQKNEAPTLLKGILTLNLERKVLEKEQTELAMQTLEIREAASRKKESGKLPNCILLAHREFHPGMMGLIAGKIAIETRKPVMLYRGYKSPVHGYIFEGSGRSFHGVPLLTTLQGISQHFLKLGGHEKAFGFCFKEKAQPLIENYLSVKTKFMAAEDPVITYDASLSLGALNLSLAHKLRKHEPFGEGFPQPIYRIFGEIYDIEVSTTKNGDHTFIHILNDKNEICKVNFYFQNLLDDFEKKQKVEALISISTSIFIHQERLSLKGIDIRACD